MFKSIIYYFKESLGLDSIEREKPYFNPEGDFQDIKMLMPVEDYTFIYFIIAAIIFMILIYFFIKYLIKKYLESKRNKNREKAFDIIQKLNVEDAKACAYLFTEFAPIFLTDENKTIFEEIEKEFMKYKYRPIDCSLTEKEIELLISFKKSCHV